MDQAGHFREAAADEGGARVVAEAAARRRAARDGEHVLDRAGDLAADNVGGGVDFEVGLLAGEFSLH